MFPQDFRRKKVRWYYWPDKNLHIRPKSLWIYAVFASSFLDSSPWSLSLCLEGVFLPSCVLRFYALRWCWSTYCNLFGLLCSQPTALEILLFNETWLIHAVGNYLYILYSFSSELVTFFVGYEWTWISWPAVIILYYTCERAQHLHSVVEMWRKKHMQ